MLAALTSAESVLHALTPDASEGHRLDQSMERVQVAITGVTAALHSTYVGDVV